ncbi:MAG TPA: HEPN domain-containing protein [Flavipsychrobacter sp.]|nr:HEPN domain-containing protein [Flavipsychrobacter sp.]
MISKRHITKTLKELNALYSASRGFAKPKLYSKLAIIEASGWIEECLDSIVRNLCSGNLSPTNYRQYDTETIKKNSGFKYEQYIRNKLLKDLIGLVLIEKFETILSANRDFITMIPALDTLAKVRNDCAHTHLSGTTPSLMAPSATIRNFEEIYNGLKAMNKQLKKLKFK